MKITITLNNTEFDLPKALADVCKNGYTCPFYAMQCPFGGAGCENIEPSDWQFFLDKHEAV